MKTKRLETKKDVIKLIRSIFEAIILLLLFYLIIRALFVSTTYEPYDESTASKTDNGFIVVSYYGVARSGNNLSMSAEELENQLKALYDSGYVTITQQDILDYYDGKKLLPPKSLFLMFEDGVVGSAIFSEKIMAKYNYKATMLTFADNFIDADTNILVVKDLKELEEDTYWEVGTSGNKLAYINVFDRNMVYLGDMDSLEFVKIRKRINDEYTHYLMDYLRDEMGIPREDYQEMTERISNEYERMYKGYEEYGKLPALYAMPMNDSEYGENTMVGALAKDLIYDMFKINFNRRVYSYNNLLAYPQELARCQPQPYWKTNHLMMRVWTDTGEDVAFRTGDEDRAQYWETLEGVAEFKEDCAALTSLPDGSATLRLKDSEDISDVKISATLEGNKLGTQEFLLRWNEEGYISVKVKNDALVVSETKGDKTELLYVYDIETAGDMPPHEMSTPLSLTERGKLDIDVRLEGDSIAVDINDRVAVKDVEVSVLQPGPVGIRSQTGVVITDTRRPIDNIYDGVFTNLAISDTDDNMYYDGRLHGLEYLKVSSSRIYKKVINWFIEAI